MSKGLTVTIGELVGKEKIAEVRREISKRKLQEKKRKK